MQYGLVYDYSERFVHLYAWRVAQDEKPGTKNREKPGTDGTDPNISAAKIGERPVCPHVSMFLKESTPPTHFYNQRWSDNTG
jgi:hypothetical protein